MQNFQDPKVIRSILRRLYIQDFKSFLMKSFETLHPKQEFVGNWHIDLMVAHLKTIKDKSIKRLLINLPPRTLKSFCVSVAWPAWILGKDPSKKIIVASYNQALSDKFSQDCKTIITSPWFKSCFPNFRIKPGHNQKHKFATTEHGFRFATSVGSTLTGEGADIIIIDDPLSSMQALSSTKRLHCINWYEQALLPRLNDKYNGAIILVMQRLHKEDLSGYLIKKKAFKKCIIPLIAEEEEFIMCNHFNYHRKQGEILNTKLDDTHNISQLQQELGSYAFAAQYQQKPLALTSEIIKQQWIMRHSQEVEQFEDILQSWDTAIKAEAHHNYSVCATWGVKDNKYYLLDIFRQKLIYPELKTAILTLQQKFKAKTILIEDKASGQQLIQELQSVAVPIIKCSTQYDKVTRLILSSVLFESGKVYFPQSSPWLKSLEAELFAFPQATHDDQVDAITQFLLWIKTKKELEFSLRRV